MTTEQDFKSSFIAVLKDLQENGRNDDEALWLLGSLASDLLDDLKATDWPSAKRAMNVETQNGLLHTFETQANAHHKAGRVKQAYAIQAMAVSLIARNQSADPQIAAGEPLLDQFITASVIAYRQQKAARAN